MIRILLLACLGFSSTVSLAETFGFKKLSCFEIIKSSYHVVLDGTKVNLIESKNRRSGNNLAMETRHTFDVDQCRFTPFSANLDCQDSASGARLSVKVRASQSRAQYHEVEFAIEGVYQMESHTFETRKIEMGKASRCFVNDLFEII